MELSFWNPQELFGVDPLGSCQTCTGWTQQGTRCANKINKADCRISYTLLDQLAAVDVISNGLDTRVRQSIAVIAEHTLCKRFHRSGYLAQLTAVTYTWCELAREHIRNERLAIDDARRLRLRRRRRLEARAQVAMDSERAQPEARPEAIEVAPRQQPQSLQPEAPQPRQIADMPPPRLHERDFDLAFALAIAELPIVAATQSANQDTPLDVDLAPALAVAENREEISQEELPIVTATQSANQDTPPDLERAEQDPPTPEEQATTQLEVQELNRRLILISPLDIDRMLAIDYAALAIQYLREERPLQEPPEPVFHFLHAFRRHDRKSLADACYICYEDFDMAAIRENPNEVCWCTTCGTNVHSTCNETWLQLSPANLQTCAFCRQPWESGDARQGLE